jgi:hypothetical protein
MFNQTDRDSANDLMFPGSPGFEAAHQSVAHIGAALIACAFSLGYWLGYQDPEKNVKYKKWNFAAVFALLIFAGSMAGLPTGFVFVGVAGICFGGGIFLGARQYKRTHGQ